MNAQLRVAAQVPFLAAAGPYAPPPPAAYAPAPLPLPVPAPAYAPIPKPVVYEEPPVSVRILWQHVDKNETILNVYRKTTPLAMTSRSSMSTETQMSIPELRSEKDPLWKVNCILLSALVNGCFKMHFSFWVFLRLNVSTIILRLTRRLEISKEIFRSLAPNWTLQVNWRKFISLNSFPSHGLIK